MEAAVASAAPGQLVNPGRGESMGLTSRPSRARIARPELGVTRGAPVSGCRVCVCVRVGRDSVRGRAQHSLHRHYTRCMSPTGHDLFYACMREGRDGDHT